MNELKEKLAKQNTVLTTEAFEAAWKLAYDYGGFYGKAGVEKRFRELVAFAVDLEREMVDTRALL